jgi:outer membrane biogenesis lipoprotein LolB
MFWRINVRFQKHFYKVLYLASALLLSACSLDATLLSLEDSQIEVQNRKSADLIYGEVVTTSKGFQLTGVFGEVSEKTESITGNSWQFEGVFYE